MVITRRAWFAEKTRSFTSQQTSKPQFVTTCLKRNPLMPNPAIDNRAVAGEPLPNMRVAVAYLEAYIETTRCTPFAGLPSVVCRQPSCTCKHVVKHWLRAPQLWTRLRKLFCKPKRKQKSGSCRRCDNSKPQVVNLGLDLQKVLCKPGATSCVHTSERSDLPLVPTEKASSYRTWRCNHNDQ